jgi:hypothetical protein
MFVTNLVGDLLCGFDEPVGLSMPSAIEMVAIQLLLSTLEFLWTNGWLGSCWLVSSGSTSSSCNVRRLKAMVSCHPQPL